MDAAASSDKDGVTRSFSHVQPSHYILKVNSFSLLTVDDKYESGDFEAGGYKWKLVVYPNGNKSKNVTDHLSLYLSISNTSPTRGWEVYAIFRLYLLDQHTDQFLILQDALGRERRFHDLKLEWGFDQFVPLEGFKDASNGYLVEDKCVFGAEIFVKERNICKVESLSRIKNAASFKHVWKIENFSKLGTSCQESEVFSAGDFKWKISLLPKGVSSVSGSHLSMYLALADLSPITLGCKICTTFTLQIMDQVKASPVKFTYNKIWFSATIPDWGHGKFIEISKLTDPSGGYLVDDVCIVEAEVTVLGISKAL